MWSAIFEGGFRFWEAEVAHAEHAPAPEVWLRPL
jgi:hypothetical protein